MKLPEIIWGTTLVIVAIAVATKTNIIKNIANKVSTRGQGSGVGVHVPADVGVTTDPDIGIGLTTILDAGKVPPDTSTTGAPDMTLRLV